MAHSREGAPRPNGSMPQWYQELKQFQQGSWGEGSVQLVNTLIPYLAIMTLITYATVNAWPYWAIAPMVLPAALFLVRTFILFHDCAHGSFLPSKRMNRIIGFVTGVLTFTAYEQWRLSHLKHHATNGQLDHRGFGDILTMTYEEYRDATTLQRLTYRAYRNPLVLFILGPFYNFIILNRFMGLRGTRAERRSVVSSNLAIAGIAVGVSLAFGFRTYLLVQMPVILVAGMMGIWLFYVQHQFEPGYWAHDEDWSKLDAAMHGASYYKLPPVLRWFTGNIGIHHVHHLTPRIPNYRLRGAFLAVPQAHVKPLTLWESFRSTRVNLWSEVQQRVLSFRQAHRLMRDEARA